MHALLAAWFSHVRDWSYLGVFVLMAIESTVFPLPSEVIVPPAAYWAARGELHFWGVVLAATLGSWAGSALSYAVARSLGRPLIMRYGRFVLVPESKWLLAERWIQRYAAAGIFFARLLPVAPPSGQRCWPISAPGCWATRWTCSPIRSGSSMS